MRFIDWFAGVGGFRRGMELEGHKCVGFCEYDKFAVMSYTAMHLCTESQLEYLQTLPLQDRQKEILKEEYRNGEWYADDIRTVDARNIPESDCWCFGFPCQDISVAGKQLGFTGNRSSLFFRVMYLLGQLKEEKRPDTLFIENVKNLLSVNGGWDFAKLLTSLDENGYDAEWQVLNSKFFGVPQNRERCFIIGHLRGRSRTGVFPLSGTNETCSIHEVGHRDGYRRNTQIFARDGITETLDTGAGRGHYTIEVVGQVPYTNNSTGQRTHIYGTDGQTGALLSTMYKEPDRVAIPVLAPDCEKITLTAQDRHGAAVDVGLKLIGGIGENDFGGRWQPGNRVYDSEGIGTTITAQPCGRTAGHNSLYAVDVTGYNATSKQDGRDAVNLTMPGSKTSCNQGIFAEVSPNLTVYAVWYPKKQCYIAIRKLTPKECFRLQGWTDEYFDKAQFVNSKSQLYKQAGNGVTVAVIQAIANKLKGGIG